MNATQGLRVPPDALVEFGKHLARALKAREFALTKCYQPHPTGAGRDRVFIVSNQVVINARQLEDMIAQAMADFPGLTKEMVIIRNDFPSRVPSGYWGIEFPNTDSMPPTYQKVR